MNASLYILPIPLAWGMPGAWEIALILLVVLLLFGGRKLPELARGMARGLKTFKSEMHDVRSSLEDVDDRPGLRRSAIGRVGNLLVTGPRAPTPSATGIRSHRAGQRIPVGRLLPDSLGSK